MTLTQSLIDFSLLAGHPVPRKPHFPDPMTAALWRDLIREESAELENEVHELKKLGPTTIHHNRPSDFIALAKEGTDLIYVTTGLMIAHGINVDRCFAEVHKSNLSKFTKGAEKRGDGKVLKGPAYRPPNLLSVLSSARALY